MADAVADGLTNLHAAVAWQLRWNHYPPVPSSMVEPCIKAIMAVADDEGDTLIELPVGVEYKNSSKAPAWAIVEGHHLYPFVETVVGEWVEDEDDEDEGETT
jgi:hypothetical protein